MKSFLILSAICVAGAALADPGYYRVSNVASDDTLNVRAAPSGSSADIGDLPFDARGVEVIDTDPSGAWGRILWEEGNGWLAMRFLAPDPVPTIAGTALPAGLQCGGTEPFWSIRLSQSGAVYSDMGGRSFAFALQGTRVAQGLQAFPVALQHAAANGRALSVIQPMLCSDQMSDRDYPYGLTVLLEADGSSEFLAGCCWLPLNAGEN